MDDLLPDFLAETNESLAELDLALVKLEQFPNDKATLSLIFRLVHTIKGTCGFLGLPRLERVAHAAENVLGRVRDGELVVTPTVISLVLASLDHIKAIVAALGATGEEPAGDDNEVILELNRCAAGQSAAVAPDAPCTPAPAPPSAHEIPADEPISAGPATPPSREMPAALLEVPTTGLAPQTEIVAKPDLEQHAEPAQAMTIRVGVDVLEELMTLVGELVLTRNQLLQISRAEGTNAFTSPLQRLSHITSDLQEGVMKTRMQPIGNAWNKLPRLVRDLAHETGKKITLDMRGQETELDRQVLELMRDPLTHMVRNSADHGLETPEERRRVGKSETGRISLNAYHEGGHIIIEVADDGRGLDVSMIRAKAISKGFATEAELSVMNDVQIRALIFRAGFSTAAAVTAISGRGVGMDVVRSNIERIGGTVELSSELGSGSRFTIKIPLTLAIVSALIVQASGERFAIPQISVLELVRVNRDAQGSGSADAPSSALMAIETIGDTPILRLRNQLLPLVSLGTLLRMDDPEASRHNTTVVVTAVGSGMLGIMVDEVFDTEEIVVKPVAPILRHVTMFSGNTILGDGSVIMILDPNGVARSAGVSATRDQRDAAATAHGKPAGSDQKLSLLLFRAGGQSTPRVVPLSLIARLEDIPKEKIEFTANGFVTQYRGKLMPLISMNDGHDMQGATVPPLPDGAEATERSQPVLVFADGERSMGLMVDAIVDIVQDELRMELGSQRQGLLGSAVVNGQAADVLDTSYWLTRAWCDWFGGNQGHAGKQRLLVVEDSAFFRQLLVPMLSAAGYDVTAVSTAGEALILRDEGFKVDAIISDIEMPDIDGLSFARRVRASGAWMDLPMIALTGKSSAADAEAGRNAGFTDYVHKLEQEALIRSLQQCLSQRELA